MPIQSSLFTLHVTVQCITVDKTQFWLFRERQLAWVNILSLLCFAMLDVHSYKIIVYLLMLGPRSCSIVLHHSYSSSLYSSQQCTSFTHLFAQYSFVDNGDGNITILLQFLLHSLKNARHYPIKILGHQLSYNHCQEQHY